MNNPFTNAPLADWTNINSKPEITVGDAGYTTLAATITALGSTPCNVIVKDTQVGGGLTIPSTMALKVLKGANITIATGTTLTINGPFEAGLYQTFTRSGSGGVVFGAGAVKEIYSEWWGAKGDNGTTDNSIAVKAAGDAAIECGAPLVFSNGIYKINTQCKWGNTAAQTGNFINIKGKGYVRIYTTSTNIDGIFCFEGPHPEVDGAGNRHNGRVLLENIEFYGALNTSKGLKFYGIQGTTVRDCKLLNFGYGSWSSNHDIATWDRCYISGNIYGIILDDSNSSLTTSGSGNTWNIVNCLIDSNSGIGIDYYGGLGANFKNNNFVENGCGIRYGYHASVAAVATSTTISGNYFEDLTNGVGAGGMIISGGGVGIARHGLIEDNIVLAASGGLVFKFGNCDTETVCRNNNVAGTAGNTAWSYYEFAGSASKPEISYGSGRVFTSNFPFTPLASASLPQRVARIYLGRTATNFRAVEFNVDTDKAYTTNGVYIIAPGIVPVDIQGLSKAAACVVTWNNHGLKTGDHVYFTGITQADWSNLNNANDYSLVTYINSNTFSVPLDTSGYAAAYDPGTDPGKIARYYYHVYLDNVAAEGALSILAAFNTIFTTGSGLESAGLVKKTLGTNYVDIIQLREFGTPGGLPASATVSAAFEVW